MISMFLGKMRSILSLLKYLLPILSFIAATIYLVLLILFFDNLFFDIKTDILSVGVFMQIVGMLMIFSEIMKIAKMLDPNFSIRNIFIKYLKNIEGFNKKVHHILLDSGEFHLDGLDVATKISLNKSSNICEIVNYFNMEIYNINKKIAEISNKQKVETEKLKTLVADLDKKVSEKFSEMESKSADLQIYYVSTNIFGLIFIIIGILIASYADLISAI